MPTFLKIVQEELKTKKRLMREDVYELAYKYKHDFDTARRALEPDKTPFSKPHKIGNRIKWWDYVGEVVEENLNEDLKELLREIDLSFDNLNKVKEINSAIKSNNDYYKKSVIQKYENNKTRI